MGKKGDRKMTETTWNYGKRILQKCTF